MSEQQTDRLQSQARNAPFRPDAGFAPKDHPKIKINRIGVLLINLGTPEGTDYRSMRRYLKEFLSDRRVIEMNRVGWWFLLNGPILTKRPFRSGKAYRTIWNTERDESPLKTITRSTTEKVGAALAQSFPQVDVDWAMRYGKPSTKSRIAALKEKGCDRILLFPLYPQYSASTTATACDKAFDALKEMRWQPTIRVVPPYYGDPAYISALAETTKQGIAALDFEPEVVLASFHGLPVEYFQKGDPYHCHCAKTTRLLRAELGWDEHKLRMTFQSRFGKAEWLKPYTDKTVQALAEEGVKRLAVITPGFAADCVETLEEIAGEAGEMFHEHGGEHFAHVPCLNDQRPGVDMLAALIRRELQGWE